MEFFYKVLSEVLIAKERFDDIDRERSLIYSKYFPINSTIKNTVSDFSNEKKDPQTEYLIELEDKGIEKEFEYIRNYIRIKIWTLKSMVEKLHMFEDVERKFLEIRYFSEKKYTLEEIAIKLNYSLVRIKQISSEVEKKLKEMK